MTRAQLLELCKWMEWVIHSAASPDAGIVLFSYPSLLLGRALCVTIFFISAAIVSNFPNSLIDRFAL